MIKTLQRRGNSHALVIDKTLMQQLGINPDTELQITVRQGSLVVTPVHVGLGRERVSEVLDGVFERYDETFRELAK